MLSVLCNQRSMVKFLLQHGANVHARTKTNVSGLDIAIAKGYVEIAELLLQNGADPDQQIGSHGLNALVTSVGVKKKSMVQLLIRYGADPNSVDNNGQSTLLFASQLGYKDIAKLLIQSGARLVPSQSHSVYSVSLLLKNIVTNLTCIVSEQTILGR